MNELEESLLYLKVTELKGICEKLQLSTTGPKGELIERILAFLKSGEKKESLPIPEASKAKKGKKYPLAPDTLILAGNYKNDLKTRLFLKKLIGEHFHFTAFGIDWIKSRWMSGGPPTYQEFADFWQKEIDARKLKKATPKQEWAYLNFSQRYLEKHLNASRKEIADGWEKERLIHYKKVQKFLS